MTKLLYDPGHGGPDDGAKYGAAEEDDLNLNMANLAFLMTQLQGLDADLTRTKDVTVSLSQRVDLANEMNPAALISIHCDAFHKETANGMTVHIHPRASKTSRSLAQHVMTELATTFPNLRDRGVKQSDFKVLRETTGPAILVECGFLSNSKERAFLREPENQYNFAAAITRGAFKQFG